jgi:hypothetical protein
MKRIPCRLQVRSCVAVPMFSSIEARENPDRFNIKKPRHSEI